MSVAMSTCSELASNMIPDLCGKAAVGGVKAAMYVLPFDYIDRTASTLSPTNPLLLTALVMQATKKGYKLEGKAYSNELMSEMVKGTYIDLWKHTVTFKVLEDTAAAAKWVDSLKNTRVVVVVETFTASGNLDSSFKVAGFDCGLELSEASSNFSDGDTKGAFALVASSNEKSLEPYPHRYYLNTSYAATKTALEALLPTP